jgi:tetratricopeptide (TPR) repeat protein
MPVPASTPVAKSIIRLFEPINRHARCPLTRKLFRSPRLKRLSTLGLAFLLAGGCTVTPNVVDSSARAPLLDGYGTTTFQASRANDAARALFAQGMAQAYAFNRPEAMRAFKAALVQDTSCGMCAWAVAWQLGPNINNPKRGDLGEAVRHVDYALKHLDRASARDRALVDALALRYGHGSARGAALPAAEICRAPGGSGEPADPLDIAFAARMRQIADRFPLDPDVLTLYAEAELVASERSWWNETSGKPTGRVGEVADRIEAALARTPEHVGLNHYMIHAVDAVPVAARAVPAADRLGRLAPKSPHLLHMPSHTYAHVGRYADATRVNQLAVAADESLMADLKRQGFDVAFDWRGHNTHFQWYGALMEGRAALALETARAAAGRAKGSSAYSEYVRSLPALTLLHLQRWDALLAEPLPAGDQGLALVLGEMARGIAMARKGDAAGSRAALARVQPQAELLVAKHSGKDTMARMLRSLAGSASKELAAELAFTEGRIDAALELQAQAVEAALDAGRAEPPMLASGPRLRLGAMQLQTRRFVEAEQSFRADLALHPGSGWALQGLGKALAAQGRQADAQAAQRALAGSWALAEAELRGMP